MHRRDEVEPRSRFGLPPEQPARRALLSPVGAFVILAAGALMAWLLIAVGSNDSSTDVPTERARAVGGAETSVSPRRAGETPPTEAEALQAFQTLDQLRATVTASDAGRVVVPGLSLGSLERAVPSGGQTAELEVLSLTGTQIRVRQVVDLSSWEVDLTAEDLAVGRAGRRLGVEWTLSREATGWRIASWTVVEDRAVVGES